MSIDFKTFRACVPSVLAARFPVLLRGRHGVGKSQVVYQTAADLGLPIVERRASQMTEGDLLGLPDNRDVQVNGRKATTFNPPEWFLTACTEPVVLFLDEVDRATTEVRQGIFELCDSRKIAGNTLHPDTVIIAAVNGGEHGAQYQVGEMDPAELDRYTVFDVEPSHEDWLDWAKDNVDSVLWDFINQNRQHLEHAGDFEPNKVYPSRRSWDRLNQTVTPMGCFAEGGDLDMLFNLTTAFCGFEAAVAVRDFVASYDRQVTVEDILDNGEIDKTADWTINEHSALVEKMEAAEIFKPELSDDQIVNLARYFVTLPSEVAMKLWTVLGDGEVQNVIRTHQSTTPEGVVISEHLITILGG
jgi:hypothetical protein